MNYRKKNHKNKVNKIYFTSELKRLRIMIPPGKAVIVNDARGIRKIYPTIPIRFENFTHVPIDTWETKEIRKWMKEHPEHAIKEHKGEI